MLSRGERNLIIGCEVSEPHSFYYKESCAMRRDAVQCGTDVTEKFVASIFRVRDDVYKKRRLPLYQTTRRHTPN